MYFCAFIMCHKKGKTGLQSNSKCFQQLITSVLPPLSMEKVDLFFFLERKQSKHKSSHKSIWLPQMWRLSNPQELIFFIFLLQLLVTEKFYIFSLWGKWDSFNQLQIHIQEQLIRGEKPLQNRLITEVLNFKTVKRTSEFGKCSKYSYIPRGGNNNNNNNKNTFTRSKHIRS